MYNTYGQTPALRGISCYKLTLVYSERLLLNQRSTKVITWRGIFEETCRRNLFYVFSHAHHEVKFISIPQEHTFQSHGVNVSAEF